MQGLKDFIRDNNKIAGAVMAVIGIVVIVVNFAMGTTMMLTVINCVIGIAAIGFGAVLAIKGVY